MAIAVATREELGRLAAAARQTGAPLPAVDRSGLCRVLEYHPADMTLTIEAGATLAALQAAAGRAGQWLPVDPLFPEKLTIADVIEFNLSGPRRFGFGTIRDYLIGARFVLASGEIIRSGGKVVKNVAGYDLLKLFIGARAALGLVVEATFKLLPRPEREAFLMASAESPQGAGQHLDAILDSELGPSVLDLHHLPPAGRSPSRATRAAIVVGFSGAAEDVAWQAETLGRSGFEPLAAPDYELHFQQADGRLHSASMLPSQAVDAAWELGPIPWILRAGNGELRWRGGPNAPPSRLNRDLAQRAKAAFDPTNVFGPLPE